MPACSTRQKPLHLIACGVFRPALDWLAQRQRIPQLQVHWLPSLLHCQPAMLENVLEQTAAPLLLRSNKVLCLYGQCFPGIDTFCRQRNLCRIQGEHCYEIFLGECRFKELMERCAGTYFLEQDLLTHFEEYCAAPLELADQEMREMIFGHYRRLIYLRQPADPELGQQAQGIAAELNLSLEVMDVEYEHLLCRLLDLIKKTDL